MEAIRLHVSEQVLSATIVAPSDAFHTHVAIAGVHAANDGPAPLWRLPGPAAKVHAYLAAHPGSDLSVAELAVELGCSVSTVHRGLRPLRKAGRLLSLPRWDESRPHVRPQISSRRIVARDLGPGCHPPMSPVTELKQPGGQISQDHSVFWWADLNEQISGGSRIPSTPARAEDAAFTFDSPEAWWEQPEWAEPITPPANAAAGGTPFHRTRVHLDSPVRVRENGKGPAPGVARGHRVGASLSERDPSTPAPPPPAPPVAPASAQTLGLVPGAVPGEDRAAPGRETAPHSRVRCGGNVAARSASPLAPRPPLPNAPACPRPASTKRSVCASGAGSGLLLGLSADERAFVERRLREVPVRTPAAFVTHILKDYRAKATASAEMARVAALHAESWAAFVAGLPDAKLRDQVDALTPRARRASADVEQAEEVRARLREVEAEIARRGLSLPRPVPRAAPPPPPPLQPRFTPPAKLDEQLLASLERARPLRSSTHRTGSTEV